jgi:hypothetical protein
MSNNSLNFGINIDIGETLKELKSSYRKFQQTRKFDEEAYNELLEKYGEAITTIETLKEKIEQMPSKEEIESMEAAINLLGNLDEEKLQKIQNLEKRFGKNEENE